MAVPDYQKSAVSSYLNNYAPSYLSYVYQNPDSIKNSNGVYNRAGRGIPDVSANGELKSFPTLTQCADFSSGANFMTWVDGKEQAMDGTSLAAPEWASMLTLVNEERTKQGKSSVGFVNSVLYENTQIFNDITDGNNPGCGTNGFSAAPGWDPATGLGKSFWGIIRVTHWLIET